MSGHRVFVGIELLATEDGGLKAPVEQGNRSLIFVFRDGAEEVSFGAVIEFTDGTAEPGSHFGAQVWFWNDRAATYATTDASFALWYQRTVGSGKVLRVMLTS